ncbi:uncharacterized protein I206_104186 [Kwoniella pini CBS 10737]|uniref:SCA7 domain-containing protein n=1 Tax=Kwoniella pini CBS 10737 TaxID=1296096 RepID=A0A1B9I2J3_9TREE|nr:uncharacterized protein I206_04239 [Kwoniella pini CBS 10737]OCF49715.1 hypothetical protein I206_04239 [Kwoniella pini CBS 10737]
MSYYRPSTLVATINLIHPIPEASSSRHPLPLKIEEEAWEHISTPAQMEKGQGKQKKIKKLSIEEIERLAGQICNVRPIGACQRPQSSGSLYCTNHSCQAINADGDRCGNLVIDPRETRFCTNGWHMENSRHTHLADLMNLRKSLNQRQEFEKEIQNAEQLYFIEQQFPSSSSSSDSVISTLLQSPISVTSTSPTNININIGKPKEKGWGSHGVDAWWRGKWELSIPQIQNQNQSSIS